MKARFTNAAFVEQCAETIMDICHTYNTGIATPITEIIHIINKLSPLHLTNSNLLLEHHIVHEDGVSTVYRKGIKTKKIKTLYKFRPKCDRSTARIFVLEVLKQRYKDSQKNYEKYGKKKEKEEVDIDELNTTLDELLEEPVDTKEITETTETTLKEFIEKQPASFTFFNHSNITLEEAIRVIKNHGGTVTF